MLWVVIVCCSFREVFPPIVDTPSVFAANDDQKQRAVGAETIWRIKQDYPKALDNRLHDFFNRIEVRMTLCSAYGRMRTADPPKSLGLFVKSCTT